jgi:hypothetical protein
VEIPSSRVRWNGYTDHGWLVRKSLAVWRAWAGAAHGLNVVRARLMCALRGMALTSLWRNVPAGASRWDRWADRGCVGLRRCGEM